MPKTLLYIGDDRATLADLTFVPGPVAHVATIQDARWLLLRPDREYRGRDYLVAYGADIAARYTGPGDGPVAPLGGAWGLPILLLHGGHGGAMSVAAQRLGAGGHDARIVSLPDDWDWLLAALADQPAKRGRR